MSLGYYKIDNLFFLLCDKLNVSKGSEDISSFRMECNEIFIDLIIDLTYFSSCHRPLFYKQNTKLSKESIIEDANVLRST